MAAVLFDLDGTLIDASRDIAGCANKVLASRGKPLLPLEQVVGFVGHGLGALVSRCMAASGIAEDAQTHAEMYAAFQACYVTSVDQTVLYPNVMPALTALRQAGYALGLCTNKPEAPTQAVVAHMGLAPFFQAASYGDGPYGRKPDPAPVAYVLDALGERDAVYVGDSETDAETAARAGLPFLLYTEGFRHAAVKDIPHHKAFNDFEALPELVAALIA
ncbi:MAG: HAD-IA family hydrolase [Pseudomonadota bacterium]